jgi:8-oxo-dGTP pyrophosphatase MutT (NUDIX family)
MIKKESLSWFWGNNMSENFQEFIVSQKGVLIRKGKALILEFTNSENKVWDIPGGRFDADELGTKINLCGSAEKSFRREIEEELGIKNFINRGVVDYDLWRVAETRAVCGVVNLIENNNDEIKLSFEHNDMKWINEAEIDNYGYVWPCMARMIKAGFEKYKRIKNKPL